MGTGGTTGTGGAGNKQTTNTNNTGQPTWTSGMTGNNPLGAPQNVGQGSSSSSSTTTTGQPNLSLGDSPGLSGNWWEPGSDAYNSMNSQLATNPMAALLQIFNTGGGTGAQNAENLTNSSGANDWMVNAANMFQQLAGPGGTANYQGVYDRAGQPGNAEQNLADMASGKMVGASNPYTDAIIRQGQGEAGDAIDRMFAKGGRYGSGANQGTIADSYQNIGNQYRGTQYNQDVANQLAASGAISQEQANRLGIQNNAAQGVGTIQQAGAQGLGSLGTSAMQNWLTGQTNAAQAGSQNVQNLLGAMGQLGNVQNNKMFDANQQIGIGNITTEATQNMINDLINQWTQGDMSDWSRLGGLLSAASGSAGNYGTASGSTSQTSKAGIGSILGGILGLL